MNDAFAYGPKKKSRKRSKILGVVIGFVTAASLTAMAAWIVIPNATGTGFGKADNASTGLALVSVDMQSNDPVFAGASLVGPSDTGSVFAVWRNDNAYDVSITQFAGVAGTEITKVGDPTCTAPASTFTITPETQAPGVWTVAGNGGTRKVSAAISTTAAFPSCLAGSLFSLQVSAQAVA
jgi:hypothetical protein